MTNWSDDFQDKRQNYQSNKLLCVMCR